MINFFINDCGNRYFEATLRAQKFVSVFVNIRGEDEEKISKAIFTKKSLSGLQGPTISPVYSKTGEKMFAIHVIVEKEKLQLAIRNLREIGGSGVVVAQTLYIFEEEPLRYKKLKMAKILSIFSSLEQPRPFQSQDRTNHPGCPRPHSSDESQV